MSSERLSALALVLAASCTALAASSGQTLRYDGEYGLRVGLAGDTVTVQWITMPPAPGVLTVLADGRVIHDETTASDTAHRARFTTKERWLTLRYGADGALTETLIDHETGKRRAEARADAPDTLFVLGDVHGEFDTMTAVLRNAGIIDGAGRWSAGRAHLAIAGDMMDRGADVTRVLWFLYGLEREAEQAGGRLHIVLGNHELMVMMGDLRYVSGKERHVAALHGFDYARLFDPGTSLLGRWLTSKPGVLRVGDVLLAHGGVAPRWDAFSLGQFDDTMAAYTHDAAFELWADSTQPLPLDSAAFVRRDQFFWDEASVFWFRGYAQSDSLGAGLAEVLDHFDASVHVVGHTPGEEIRQAYDGALILTNTLPFGREILRLVRSDDRWERMRIGTAGEWLPVRER